MPKANLNHASPAWPVAMTVAGSDSGGGAGIQADLKTFAALHVHGTSAITCVTAQNPREVRAVQPIKPRIVRQQIEALLEELPPRAVKTGMLYSAPLIREVLRAFRGIDLPLVVDPVMVATSGAILLQDDAIQVLKEELLPRAALVTPNLHEAEILSGRKIRNLVELTAAARQIHETWGCAALVKGGHLKQGKLATDIFYDGKAIETLAAPFLRDFSPHGTGCTCAAAITGYLARGEPLRRAVAAAKRFITEAIRRSYLAGGHTVLNPQSLP